MQGFLVTFYTQQDRRHAGQPLCDWLLELARSLQLMGATLSTAAEGFGHDGQVHSQHFFELADQPVQVRLAMTAEQCERLFERLENEDLALFYVKSAVEMGSVGRRKAERDDGAA
ncbi:MAG: hypothetical protein GAK43_02727 [Stenotrophomonas maltophilia]|nr:MAG: hypothetical protein GAK43_02727 [Stenotrophomonas maltophilia]